MTFDEFAGARLPAMLRFATALTGDPDLAKDLASLEDDHPKRLFRA